jgi:hypothetical protein
MKRYIKVSSKLIIAFIAGIMLISSCQDRKYADTDWPDQKIYMPAALYNPFAIDAVPKAIGSTPTVGFPTRFLVDTVARKFNVLLAAYRSGVNNEGAFTVDIKVNTDTITKILLIPGRLPAGTVLLPADKYTIPTTAEMKDGKDLATFELSVDLDFLLANNPAGKYAIAVGISSTARVSNPKYATTIILIDTKIMKPTAAFTSAAAAAPPLTRNFTNTALYGTKFIWYFGDGTERKITTNAKNEAVAHTYAVAGTYTVTLVVQGVADWAQKATFSTSVIIP